jgi:arylsulfatase
MVNGVLQSPIEGTSMLYTFNEAEAPDRHDLQYFEMFANRGIYHRGWSAVTKHRTPWGPVVGALPAFDDDVWELYDGTSDYSQAHNLAADQPEMLAKLQRLWMIEATKYQVLPMDDRTAERFVPELAGRPTLIRGTSQLFFPGMGRLSENSVVNIKNKSFSVTAEVEVPERGAEGVIIAQGGRFGGWALYAKGGKAKFVYNVLGIQEFSIAADEPIPAGTHQVRMEFAYDGGGLAKGGDVTLYYDGTAVGTGRVGVTQPMVFSGDETTDIGYESGTTVTPDYTARDSRFVAKIHWVQIDLGDDDHDHFIDPDERLRIAMARQ